MVETGALCLVLIRRIKVNIYSTLTLLTPSGMSSAMLSVMGFLGGKVRHASRPAPMGCPRRGGGAEGARGGGCPLNSLSLSVLAICSTEHDWSSSATPPPRLKPSPRASGPPGPAGGILTSAKSGYRGRGLLNCASVTISRAPLGRGGGGKSGGGRFNVLPAPPPCAPATQAPPSSSEEPSSAIVRAGGPAVALRG